ncbi:iron permease [Pholiota conissans]|uniref:Iron permease n=1 Tax=Pholiota conissans TaxID=109636 RepID=A0A9P5ZCY8_9AGAR|nr:iron permease [Pholiota conissans]
MPLEAHDPSKSSAHKRDSRFWLVFAANLLIDFLPALDLTAVSTALPTIVGHLNGTDFIWVGSAYTIASTAILPLVGGLAATLGRKPILLGFIIFFALGSAISGAATSMNMLIAGRVVQGVGGGGLLSVTEIIYSDLVPLPERGKFLGIIASVWALACAIGPPIGGSLAQSGSWRWLFYLNIPICAVAFILALLFLNVQVPRQGFKNMLEQMDWIGLTLVVSGTTAVSLALAWGGDKLPWDSYQVLVPLCLGLVALVAFFIVEFKVAEHPTIPPFILKNVTTLSGLIGTAMHGLVSMAAIFYLPVYFQASKLSSPMESGTELLAFALMIPFMAILAGVSIEYFNIYRPQNYIGWVFIVVGFGLLSMLEPGTSRVISTVYQAILGIGFGILWIATQFPVMAPLPTSNNSHALAFFTFVRVFAQNWGTVIGGAILQNKLASRLPAEVLAAHPGAQIIYSLIPQIGKLPSEIRLAVQQTYADGLRTIWYAMLGISALGLLSCLIMQEVEMREALDETWGLQEPSEVQNGRKIDASNTV